MWAWHARIHGGLGGGAGGHARSRLRAGSVGDPTKYAEPRVDRRSDVFFLNDGVSIMLAAVRNRMQGKWLGVKRLSAAAIAMASIGTLAALLLQAQIRSGCARKREIRCGLGHQCRSRGSACQSADRRHRDCCRRKTLDPEPLALHPISHRCRHDRHSIVQKKNVRPAVNSRFCVFCRVPNRSSAKT